MDNKVLLLLSNLRGIERLFNQFHELFPENVFTPILFGKKPEGIIFNDEWRFVDKQNIDAFIHDYDFSGVVAIYISFMTEDKVLFIRNAPPRVKVIWSIPGGDLYNRYLRYFGYSIVYKENRSIKLLLGKLVRYIPRRYEFNYLVGRCSAINSAYCDYDLIRKFIPAKVKMPKHVYSLAYPMEKMMGVLYGKPFVENDCIRIMVGNSASKTNNHLYVLEYLKKVGFEDINNLSLLMSYGDSDCQYEKKVVMSYQNYFGARVAFIRDYVPLEEFNRSLLSVTHFIYGNWRQEAVGNILTAFYLGGKVYLSRRNPLLKNFQAKGFVVFCLEEIELSFNVMLSESDKKKNRYLIDELYNVERANSLLKNGLTVLFRD